MTDDLPDDSQIDDALDMRPEILTPENADELILEYFSVEPYSTSWNDKGKMIRVPCDVRTPDGFSAKYNIPLSDILPMVSPKILELCKSKFKNIMLVNGLNRGYDGGAWGLTMKNEAGYSEKSTNTEVREVRLLPEDLAILEGLGMKVIEDSA